MVNLTLKIISTRNTFNLSSIRDSYKRGSFSIHKTDPERWLYEGTHFCNRDEPRCGNTLQRFHVNFLQTDLNILQKLSVIEINNMFPFNVFWHWSNILKREGQKKTFNKLLILQPNKNMSRSKQGKLKQKHCRRTRLKETDRQLT